MARTPARILVIDDDPDVLTAARLLLKRHFAVVQTEGDPEALPALFESERFDAVVLDMNFRLGAASGAEGFRWMRWILERAPGTAVVLMTAYGDVGTAVQAIKEGATDFVLKPWQNEKLLATLSAAVRLGASRAEVDRLTGRQRKLVADSTRAAPLIADSPTMREVMNVVSRVAPTEANVLLLGENGTGKELLAREIHRRSARADDVFLSVDLGSVTESLFESELFGHLKGAFTDARDDRVGRFRAASGGTLFLDEIGNLPLHLQGRLLTALEQREVVPVGSDRAVPIDVRLICATNRPIDRMVAAGEFREDLRYRVNTVELHLPPLRDRRDDVPALLEHFGRLYADKYGLTPKPVSRDALARLLAYRWPGNVRELRHAVERALIMSQGAVLESADFLFAPTPEVGTGDGLALASYDLEEVEKAVVRKVMLKHAGNVSHAAAELGITRTSLYRRLQKYGL